MTLRRDTLGRAVRRSAALRAVLLAGDTALKRSLATALWAVYRSRLNAFTFTRGADQTSGRLFIRRFLTANRHEVRGRVLEFGGPYFREEFDAAAIERYDIIDVVPRQGLTWVADVQRCPEVPDETFDAIVCTQVLEHVIAPHEAIAEMHRILRPGGRLLVSVPAAFPYHADPRDYWRFTRDSLELLLGRHFDAVTITPFGNELVVVAAYWWWMAGQLPRGALERTNPDSPTNICALARKAG